MTTTLDTYEPVTIEEAKQQCYLIEADTQTENHLQFLIEAARVAAENRTWQDFRGKKLEVTLQDPECVEIPFLHEVESVTVDGQSFEDYKVDGDKIIAEWPEGEVKILCTTEPPEPVKMGILYLVKHFFDNRDSVSVSHGSVSVHEIPMTVQFLIDPYSKRVPV